MSQIKTKTGEDLMHVKFVCKAGQGGRCCKYLSLCTTEGFTCEKENPLSKMIIDRQGHQMISQGDNCAGYTLRLKMN